MEEQRVVQPSCTECKRLDTKPQPKVQNQKNETGDSFDIERRRIRAAYARRAAGVDCRRYSLFNPYALYATQERERVLLELLREAGVTSLDKMRILDVGSGEGGFVRRLLDYGAEPNLTVGFDLIEGHLRKAQTTNLSINYVCGDGIALPFRDHTFDLALQFTVFTSVLNSRYREAIAREMLRILRPQGKVVWYDFIYDNPKNPDVKGIGRSEIRTLFPGCKFRFRRVTLIPPLGRSLPPFVVLYDFLSLFRLFSSHYICVIEKP